jgi:hypothetical protein
VELGRLALSDASVILFVGRTSRSALKHARQTTGKEPAQFPALEICYHERWVYERK